MKVVTATHHSAVGRTTRATETTEGQGPSADDGAHFQEKASVTPKLEDAYATSFVTAKQIELQATDESLDCLVWDVTDHVGIIHRRLKVTRMYFTSGTTRTGRAFHHRRAEYQAHEAQCFHGQGARQTYAEVEVREPREPFPSQIPGPALQVAEYEDLLCSSTRTIDTRNGANRGGFRQRKLSPGTQG